MCTIREDILQETFFRLYYLVTLLGAHVIWHCNQGYIEFIQYKKFDFSLMPEWQPWEEYVTLKNCLNNWLFMFSLLHRNVMTHFSQNRFYIKKLQAAPGKNKRRKPHRLDSFYSAHTPLTIFILGVLYVSNMLEINCSII